MTEDQKAGIRHDTVMAMMDDARLAVRVVDPEAETARIERLTAEAERDGSWKPTWKNLPVLPAAESLK